MSLRADGVAPSSVAPTDPGRSPTLVAAVTSRSRRPRYPDPDRPAIFDAAVPGGHRTLADSDSFPAAESHVPQVGAGGPRDVVSQLGKTRAPDFRRTQRKPSPCRSSVAERSRLRLARGRHRRPVDGSRQRRHAEDQDHRAQDLRAPAIGLRRAETRAQHRAADGLIRGCRPPSSRSTKRSGD
jgi:hypothetical protein